MHPQRLVILAAAGAAIGATWLTWVHLAGISPLTGTNIWFWSGSASVLTAHGISDGWVTLAISASVTPFVVIGERSMRLPFVRRSYVLVVGFLLTTTAVVESIRVLHLEAEHLDDYGRKMAEASHVGSGVYLLGLAGLVLIVASLLWWKPPRPQ